MMKPQTCARGGDNPAKSQSAAAAPAVTVMSDAAPAKSANAGAADTAGGNTVDRGNTVADTAGGSVAASANAGNTAIAAATVANPAAVAGAPAAPLYLGIDVAKAELVVAVRDGARVRRIDAYANSNAGIAKLLRRAAKDAGGREVRACLESTAGYEAAAALALFEAGHAA